MPNLPIIPPIAPEGFCQTLGPDWVNQILQLVGQAVAVFADVGTITLNQETQPSPEQFNYLWYKPSTGLTYRYESGAWISPHIEEAGGNVRRSWKGTTTELETYDGGAAGAVGANSGPMWEEDTDFIGRSPMGPGAIPTSSPAKSILVGEQFGEGSHLQTEQEVGPHRHPLQAPADNIKLGDDVAVVGTGGGEFGMLAFNFDENNGSRITPLSILQNKYTTTQLLIPVVHPVCGLYWIKRTGRVNYVG